MRPDVLTIAGFDPTGGAGVLADIKTFESCKCQGFAVQTCNTIQTEDTFLKISPVDEDIVCAQLETLLNAYRFRAVKIGLMSSVSLLKSVVSLIKSHQPEAKIIWDPIVASSSGFVIHRDFRDIKEILNDIFLITPNWGEASYFNFEGEAGETLRALSAHTKIYLKGGHNPINPGVDELISDGRSRFFAPKKGTYFPKHGSGCVFSAALAAHIAKGYPLQKAILKSKRYVEHFLKSNDRLLGFHKV